MEVQKEISLRDILDMMLDHKWLISICTFVFAALFFVYSAFLTVNTYTSSGTIFVSNHVEGTISSTYSTGLDDLDSSKSMAATCIELLRTRSYLQYVSRAVDEKYTWEEIGDMVSLSSVNETELLSIAVTTADPQDSYDIAVAIIEKAPEQLGTAFVAGNFEVIDRAEFPEEANSRGIVKKTFIGLVFGFIVGAALAFMLTMFDKKIRTDEYVAQKYDITLLGYVNQ